jgi:hypothetical protein
MNRVIKAGLIACTAGSLFIGCKKSNDTVAVTDITLNPDKLMLETGQEFTLTATVTPDNATDKTLTWESSNSDKATVTNGKVTATGNAGDVAVITATTANGKKATCTVTALGTPTQTWNIGTPTASSVQAKLYGTAPNQTLIISGTGKMQDFTFNGVSANTPWWSIRANIKTIIINAGVTSIGEIAFYRCTGLTSITIPNGITSIGIYAFSDCTGLTSATIGSSVTFIGDYAFYGCTGLATITAQNPTPLSGTNMGTDTFYNINKTTCTLKVPKASVATYKAAAQWKDFANIVGI